MKNKKLATILYIAVLTLLIIAEALTGAIILRLGMLPGKYVSVLILALVLFASLIGLLMFLSSKGKKVGKVRRIIACVLALIMVCGCAFVSKVASDAYRAIHSVTNVGEKVDGRNMYVLVRVDDPAQTLADTAEYTYAMVERYNLGKTEQAIAEIEKTTGKTLNLANYASASVVVDALLNKDADAAILSGISITLLLDEEGYEDLLNKVRILETIAYVEEEKPTETTQPSKLDITQKPFVVYISGSDTRSKKLNVSRSDVNIVMIVNPVSKQVLLVNTPRDYYIPNPAGDGALDKLTHCGIYGIDCSVEALEDLYDVDISYYAQINFTGFKELVDAIGGITVYADHSFTGKFGHYFKKGENKVNGDYALAFARERKNVAGGDNGRGKNQMKVITAILDKMTSGTTIISNYSSILESLSGMFTTNIGMDEISKLVKMQLDDMARWEVKTFAVTGTGGSAKTYSTPGSNAYVMYPDEEMVVYASQLIDKMFAGETITDADLNPTEADNS